MAKPLHIKKLSLKQKILKSPYLLTLLKGSGVFVKNYESGEAIPNTIWKNLGYSDRDMKHDSWLQVVHPEDLEKTKSFHERLVKGENDLWEGEYRIRARSGEYHTIRHRAIVLERSEQKTPRLYIGWDVDITDLVLQLETVKKQLDHYRQLLQRSEEIRNAATILSTTLDPYEAAEQMIYQASRILTFDAATVRVLEDDEVILLAASGFQSGVDPACIPNLLLQSFIKPDPTPKVFAPASGPYRHILGVPIIKRNKLIGCIEFYSKKENCFTKDQIGNALLFAEQAGVAFANALRHRISEQEAATDWLTGLPTRRSFHARINRFLLENRPDETFALLLIDIDHFKHINDNYGHLFGDTVLVAIAGACKEAFRTQDISCRYGGEEILVVLPGADEKIALAVAERIRDHIQHLHFDENPEVAVTVSIGIHCTTIQTDIREAISCADEALYRAKESGRNRCILYN
ncbi:diguanylate cyclase [Gracilinema caldarium]|uniref:sensor domain-containing diguanylate cyclase n=1 Tax=Gracilinema caldarium TaxID=215591 RepID=UPI0026E931E8|nr:diguanylate cyclase [Gracilinema caldarium]